MEWRYKNNNNNQTKKNWKKKTETIIKLNKKWKFTIEWARIAITAHGRPMDNYFFQLAHLSYNINRSLQEYYC